MDLCVLAMPSYGGGIRPEVAAAFFTGGSERRTLARRVGVGSLLCRNFNDLWCFARNLREKGHPVKYFAMQHDDIAPLERWWLDTLIDELDAGGFDVLGVTMPIKDDRGITSCGLGDPDPATALDGPPLFTTRAMQDLPTTFTAADIGHADKVLLLNTGLWVCRFDGDWIADICFKTDDAIRRNPATGEWEAVVQSEDWHWSRQLHAKGLRVGITKTVKARHYGPMAYRNYAAWGVESEEIAVRGSCADEPIRDGRNETCGAA